MLTLCRGMCGCMTAVTFFVILAPWFSSHQLCIRHYLLVHRSPCTEAAAATHVGLGLVRNVGCMRGYNA